MGTGEHGPPAQRRFGFEPAVADRPRAARGAGPGPVAGGRVIETIVSPFQCLYKDAIELHTLSQLRLNQSESEASRLARAAFLLYMAAAEALVHQAAAELARPELADLVCDPQRPRPPLDAWRLLPALTGKGPVAGFDPESPPWPQLAELLALRASWSYPGPPEARRAYYHAPPGGRDFEPLQPHQVPPGLDLAPEALHFPRTGLPRDPYALRPHHLNTAREVLDAAVAAIDARLGGALTRDGRHFKEPVRVAYPPES